MNEGDQNRGNLVANYQNMYLVVRSLKHNNEKIVSTHIDRNRITPFVQDYEI